MRFWAGLWPCYWLFQQFIVCRFDGSGQISAIVHALCVTLGQLIEMDFIGCKETFFETITITVFSIARGEVETLHLPRTFRGQCMDHTYLWGIFDNAKVMKRLNYGVIWIRFDLVSKKDLLKLGQKFEKAKCQWSILVLSALRLPRKDFSLRIKTCPNNIP